MAAKEYDRKLGIRTVGLREWTKQNDYNRYEGTPYIALERLFQNYKLRDHHQVVDFGCGRGRVVFYIHNEFEIPVTGIEAHDQTYSEALDNKMNYRQANKAIQAPIKLKYGLAEDYQVKPNDNIFYLFNPFSHQIFAKVMENITTSLKKHPRNADLILYYPLPEYKKILRDYSNFQMINRVRVPGLTDALEKFNIYRWRMPELNS